MNRVDQASRRKVLGALAGFGVLSALGPAAWASGGKGKFAVGFIYIGAANDLGYNQAHAAGAHAVAALSDVEIHELYSIPEGKEASVAIKMLAGQKNCRIIFATSYGYFNPYVLEAARQYPDVVFLHAGAVYRQGIYPENVGTYFAYTDEAQYISGLVAGLMSATGRMGFIAAKPIPQVLRNINAFMLGARRANPQAEMVLQFTGDWSNPQNEMAAFKMLADKKVDVISCHIDSPIKLAALCEAQGIHYCGYHFDQSSIAPKFLLTGAEFDWTHLYPDYVKKIRSKKDWPRAVRAGFAGGLLRNTPYGPLVPAAVRAEADRVREMIKSGKMFVFSGPVKDNNGKLQITAGQKFASTAQELEKMYWLAEGIIGNLPR
ncbi:BMP family ABC transporter substrate-binding protein [Iodobacter sp. LRB]|uniref:BMP family ABC transporter substrate-binding protein n=1 Tax=unclassified Iodobacter TaxID=235634 RepID=UPI000C108ACE|nr:BMP family ABC transporter substrate-binding protein [Iodobacter sp. BJB302]PHU99836.1 BMP family ABC transporter substrate-binding protein [Iodobacter sp. BJB302]